MGRRFDTCFLTGLTILFCSLSVYGSKATIPTKDIQMNLTLSSEPEPGEEFMVTFTFALREKIAHKNKLNDEAHIWLPYGIELVSGSSTWEGRLQKDKTETIQITAKTTQPGSYTFHGVVNSCQIDPSHIPRDPSLEQRIGRQIEEKAFAFRNVVSEKIQIGQGEEVTETWSIDASTGEAKMVKMKGQFPPAPPSIATGQLRVVGLDSPRAEPLDSPRTEEKTITGSSPGDSPSSTLAKPDQKEVTFEKVQEKTYEEFIRAIAFGTTTGDGEQQMYCKVIVLEDKEVQFLDESGQVISRTPLLAEEFVEGKFYGRRAILSRRGNFVAIYDYISKPGEELALILEQECTVFNDRGKEIYKIKSPVERTNMENQLLISDKDGSAIGTRLDFGALDFYSPTGDIKIVPIFGEIGWGKSTGGAVTFSEDGEHLAVLVGGSAKSVPGSRPFRTDVLVALFDKSGNELWRREVQEHRFGNVTISGKGEHLFFKAFTFAGEKPRRKKGEDRPLASVTLGLYGKDGNELSFKDTSLFTFGSFCFSPQADYVALAGHNLIRLIKTKDGSTVFEKELPKDKAIRQLFFSGDGEYLIVPVNVPVGKEKMTERRVGREYRTIYGSRVFLYDMKGNQVWHLDFPTRLRGIFSENGFLAFRFPYSYEIHKIIEGQRSDE